MDLTNNLRLEVQTAKNDAFVWNVSTWTGYRWGGPADTPEAGTEWTDILGPSHDIKIKRGAKRDGLSLALDAGLLSATVYDSSVDPNVNPYIKMGTPIRLMYSNGSDQAIFTGVIKTVKVTYRDKKPQVFITAVDKVKDIANINRSGVVAGTYAERVADLLGKHGIAYNVTGSSALVLAQNAFDSTLANHLQLAANTEQGLFFVDRNNVVQARGAAASNPAVSITFTDQQEAAGTDVEYTDIQVAYDSEAMSNDIYVENLTYGLNEALEPISVHTKYGPYRNVTSIVTYGAYSEEILTNFSTQAEVDTFAAAVLAEHDAPELRVDSVRFNAKEYLDKAAALEVFDTVNVEYSNEAFHIGEDFRVLDIEHTITAGAFDHKWIVDVGLISIGGGA